MERYIECGANLPNGGFMRNVIIKESELDNFIKRFKASGVFKTAYSYDSENQADSLLLGDLYLDFDGEYSLVKKEVSLAINYFKVIFKLDFSDILIYFSGSKGIHLIIPKEIFGIEPAKHLNRAFKLIVENVARVCNLTTVDLKIYDSKRLFRITNTRHAKTGLYKIPLTYTEFRDLGYDELVALASNPKEEIVKTFTKHPTASSWLVDALKQVSVSVNKPKAREGVKTFEYEPPCISDILNSEIGEGSRNHCLAYLTSYFVQQKVSEEEAKKRIDTWNNTKVNPSIDSIELEKTISSIYKGEHRFGCSTGKSLGLCSPNFCKIRRS